MWGKLTPAQQRETDGLMAAAVTHYRVSFKEIIGPRRAAWLVRVRRTIAQILRERGYSFPKIGRVLRRDHSTVIQLLRGKVR